MKQKMYRCAYCPNETEKCVKIVTDECETCLEEKNVDNMGETDSVG